MRGDDAHELGDGPRDGEGLPHGRWRHRDDDSGAVRSEGRYRHGVPHGEWSSFHASGHVAARGSFFDGRREGLWTYHHASGALAAEGTFVRDQREGRWREHLDDGGTVRESEWSRGLLHGEMIVRTGGVVAHEGSYREGRAHGGFLRYSLAGALVDERVLLDGRREGPWRAFWPNGMRRAQGAYLEGLPHGAFRWWSDDGALTASGVFARGRRDGRFVVRGEEARYRGGLLVEGRTLSLDTIDPGFAAAERTA